ncbi:hypothetical protein BJX61DRAFT_91326 [Aspergillus egyptiacus]|nr:hypothetical protein BJX61DRAFT_91326 [Aspergillus egyptiacus]
MPNIKLTKFKTRADQGCSIKEICYWLNKADVVWMSGVLVPLLAEGELLGAHSNDQPMALEPACLHCNVKACSIGGVLYVYPAVRSLFCVVFDLCVAVFTAHYYWPVPDRTILQNFLVPPGTAHMPVPGERIRKLSAAIKMSWINPNLRSGSAAQY